VLWALNWRHQKNIMLATSSANRMTVAITSLIFAFAGLIRLARANRVVEKKKEDGVCYIVLAW